MKTRIIITIAALALAAGHNIWPEIKVDLVTLIFIVVASLPWLASVIKSLELPGGFKIELNDVKAATEKVRSMSSESSTKARYDDTSRNLPDYAEPYEPTIKALREVAQTDPRLALVGLRIELEKRLTQLAEAKGIDSRRKSAGAIVRALLQKEVMHPEVAVGLSELVSLGNSAAHGAQVTPAAADWALESAPLILSILDNWLVHEGVDGDV
ncbi:MAG: DUF4145 domain-containing protein [Geobacteraceae bacterium]